MFIKDIFLEYVFIKFSFVIVIIIDFDSFYVALAGLEVSVLNRMTLSSQRPPCLSAGKKGLYHYTWIPVMVVETYWLYKVNLRVTFLFYERVEKY